MIHAQNGQDRLLIAPRTVTAAQTATANFDTRGGDYATIRIGFAAEIDTSAIGPTISLSSSDDTEVTNFVTVVANRTAEDLVAARELVYHVDTRSAKRYLRLAITAETHTTHDVLSVCAIGTLTRLGVGAGSTTNMVATTNDKVVIVS